MNIIGGPVRTEPAVASGGSVAGSARERDLGWERIIERCRLVNSIHEELCV